MRFGLCKSTPSPEAYADWGADYLELRGDDVWGMSKEDFDALCRSYDAGAFSTYSVNGLLPAKLRVTGSDADLSAAYEYCKKTFERLARLGISMLVFGSSFAKKVPEGFSFGRAWEQLAELGSFMSDCAAQYGQTIAVEPLSYTEVNIVNTVGDAAYYAALVNRKNFGILADFYHLNANGENIEALSAYRHFLVHTHIASPGRINPITDRDWAFVERCLGVLRDMDYQGGVSFEGKIVFPEAVRDTGRAAFFRETFDRMRAAAVKAL